AATGGRSGRAAVRPRVDDVIERAQEVPVGGYVSAREWHEVVGVHDLAALLLRQLVGRPADHAGQFPGVVGHDAAGDHALLRVDQVDDVAGHEVTVDAGDPGGQQRAPTLHHGSDRTVVQVQAARRAGRVAEPEAASREAGFLGGE